MQIEKSQIRNQARVARKEILDKAQKSEIICKKLISSRLFLDATDVFVYVSSKDEVSTFDIISECFLKNKRVSAPVCDVGTHTIEFYNFKSFDDLKPGEFKILTPKKEKKAIFCENTLLIVPGLAFSKSTQRLGMGGGYYDRFLANFDGKSVGLCFDDLIFDSLPCDKFDKKVDFVFTEHRIIERY